MSKPEIRYVELRDRPSAYYLRTGRIVWHSQLVTLEELERTWPSRSQSEQSPEKPHEQSNPKEDKKKQ